MTAPEPPVHGQYADYVRPEAAFFQDDEWYVRRMSGGWAAYLLECPHGQGDPACDCEKVKRGRRTNAR